MENKHHLILASASPRRKELLAHTFLPFEIMISDIDENSDESNPEKLVVDLARKKALHVLDMAKDCYKNPIVLGADTIVVLEGNILGKPKNIDHAREMLTSLSGKTHEVYTGVFICSPLKNIGFYEKTSVQFDRISKMQLEKYLQTGESLDKAGSYGIQSQALSFINKIDGSYSNVVGLPVNRVFTELNTFLGVDNFYECF